MKIHTLPAVALIVISIAACDNDKKTNAPGDANLLINGSFELGGLPSQKDWTTAAVDSTFVQFSTDTPAGGGSYSLSLRNEWAFPGRVTQTVVPDSGTHRYKLSAFGKARGLPVFGSMYMLIQRAGVWSTSKSLYFADTTWVTLSLLDTLATGPGDTIAVKLSGDIGQFGFGYTLFDMVSFERLD